jgi:hypothetical protein
MVANEPSARQIVGNRCAALIEKLAVGCRLYGNYNLGNTANVRRINNSCLEQFQNNWCIYGALSENRPYREALAPSHITAIMDRDVPAKLDGTCYEAPRTAAATWTGEPHASQAMP